MRRRQERSLDAYSSSGALRLEHVWLILAILVIGTIIYVPALAGPFLFDDLAQPYTHRAPHLQSIGAWLTIVRPLLMASFWLNYRMSGDHTVFYHLFNLLFHLLNSILVYFIMARLLELARTGDTPIADMRDRWLAGFAAFVFLVHPLQTEAVSYVVSRSENLTACFMLAAYLVFLHRAGAGMNWRPAIAIAGLFALAGITKEIAVALVPLILLSDWFFQLGGARKNWRLYGLLGAGAVAASALVYLVLKDARSAGFAVHGVKWFEYLFTQWRALLVYLRLYVAPVGQTIDHDFPISRNMFEYGSWLALLILLAGVAVVVSKRRSWGLVSFGILAWIALLSPTSSVVPIRDPLVEHRMYLPIIGLIVASVGLIMRIRIPQRLMISALSVLLGILCIATYSRNVMWGQPSRLWREAMRVSPGKARSYTNLASIYLSQNNCREASRVFASAPRDWRPDYYAMVTWGVAESCLTNYDRAVNLLQRAFTLVDDTWEHTPTSATARLEMLIGWTLLKKGDQSGSIDALDRALKLDPTLDMAYTYRGRWKQHNSNLSEAAKDFQRALELNPRNPLARHELDIMFQQP